MNWQQRHNVGKNVIRCFRGLVVFICSILNLRNWYKYQKPLEKNKMAFWLGSDSEYNNNQVDVSIVGTDFYTSKDFNEKKPDLFTSFLLFFSSLTKVFALRTIIFERLSFSGRAHLIFFSFRILNASFANKSWCVEQTSFTILSRITTESLIVTAYNRRSEKFQLYRLLFIRRKKRAPNWNRDRYFNWSNVALKYRFFPLSIYCAISTIANVDFFFHFHF